MGDKNRGFEHKWKDCGGANQRLCDNRLCFVERHFGKLCTFNEDFIPGEGGNPGPHRFDNRLSRHGKTVDIGHVDLEIIRQPSPFRQVLFSRIGFSANYRGCRAVGGCRAEALFA